MNFWIIVSILGFLLTLTGFVFFIKNYRTEKKMSNAYLIPGIFIPILIAFSYSESVMKMIPQLTLLDIAAFFIVGMISGFFLSLYLLQNDQKFNKTNEFPTTGK